MRGTISDLDCIWTNLDCNYTFSKLLAPNGIPLGAKSIGKAYIQSKFCLIPILCFRLTRLKNNFPGARNNPGRTTSGIKLLSRLLIQKKNWTVTTLFRLIQFRIQFGNGIPFGAKSIGKV